MGPVSRWAVNRPWQAIIVWVVLLLAIFTAAALHPGKFNDSFSLPNTDSTKAQQLLASQFGSKANNASVQILYSGGDKLITDASVQGPMQVLVDQVKTLGSVDSVQAPWDYPSIIGAAEQGLVGQSGTIGKLNVVFKTPDTDVPKADGKAIIDQVRAADSTALTVGAAGTVISNADGGADISEIVGIIAAIVILLIMFGSVVAAGLPLMTALLGLGAGIGLLVVAANVVSTASFAPTLAAMIGLGVGLDYSLFLLNRYRQALRDGSAHKEAAHTAVGTAGRAISFAALTVIIALSGLFVLRLSFLNGLAVGAAVTVVCVMVTAVTLLPAVISLLGDKVFAGKMPWARKEVAAEVRGRRFRRYAELVEKRHWLFGIGALLLMLFLAIPAMSMREGFPDGGSNPPGDPQRSAYSLTSRGFGVGANGPFIVRVSSAVYCKYRTRKSLIVGCRGGKLRIAVGDEVS